MNFENCLDNRLGGEGVLLHQGFSFKFCDIKSLMKISKNKKISRIYTGKKKKN
jgi:hypothetical protein